MGVFRIDVGRAVLARQRFVGRFSLVQLSFVLVALGFGLYTGHESEEVEWTIEEK